MTICEDLERRVCLSGNVTLKLVGSQLRIIGDAEANAVTVEAPLGLMTGFTSTYVFRGVNGTTIDGKATLSFDAGMSEAINFSSIRLAAAGGNDTVDFRGHVGGAVSIDLGAGDDVLSINDDYFSSLDIFGNDGNDRIRLSNFDVERRLRVFLGAGRDRSAMTNVNLLRGFDIDDNGSGGIVSLAGVTARRESTIALGNAADRLTILNGRFVEPLTVFAKGGDDQIAVDGFVSNAPSIIYGNAGDDTFDLAGERINLTVTQ